MSEPISPLQPNIDTMAAELSKRRRRLILLNFSILLVPLAAAGIFLAFGNSDREWVNKEVKETVAKTVPPRVDETVPPTVKKVLEENRVMERLADLEKKLGTAETPAEETAEAPTNVATAPGQMPADLSDRLKTQAEGLKTLQDTLKGLTNPASERSLPALWGKLEEQKTTQNTQKDLLDEHTRQIQILDQVRLTIVEQKLFDRLTEAERILRTLPTDQLAKLPEARKKLDDLGKDLGTLQENLKKLDDKWIKDRKKDQDAEEERFSQVGRKIDEVEKSAFRSTLTRELDEVTISSLDFMVKTGKLEKHSDDMSQLTRLTVQPPGESEITLGSPFLLEQPRRFSHKGCNYTIKVRRVTDIRLPKFRDYVEILLERQCPAGGKTNSP